MGVKAAVMQLTVIKLIISSIREKAGKTGKVNMADIAIF